MIGDQKDEKRIMKDNAGKTKFKRKTDPKKLISNFSNQRSKDLNIFSKEYDFSKCFYQ